MKVVILAGGRGSRLGTEAEQKPKPMARIGDQPILWHIMKHFSFQGFDDFLIATGYRGECIREYFRGELEHDWGVDVVDTGLMTGTAGRIKRLSPQLGSRPFTVAYGDGLCDVNFDDMLRHHYSHGKIATVLSVHPPSRFGRLKIEGDFVRSFEEKGIDQSQWINGSIFIFNPEIFDYIDNDSIMLEQEPLSQLAGDGQLIAYKHESFWQCMDFPTEHEELENRWKRGDAPWASWLTSDTADEMIVPMHRPQRVLVTGHRGYLGNVLVPQLLDAGHDVCGLDSDIYETCGFTSKVASREAMRTSDIPSLKIDVRDIRQEQLRNFDAVIHLAGLCNDPLGDLDPAVTFEINHQAAVDLAQKAKAAGVPRFLQASTCSIYGGADDGWLDEDSIPRPLTPYAESKLFVERDVSRLADDDFSPTFLRMGTVYGLSPKLRGDLVVNNLVAYAVMTGNIVLKSLGTSWRPLLHVEDAAQAFCEALSVERHELHNTVFNVGSTTENFQVRSLAEQVQAELPGLEIVFADGAIADHRNYRVRCDRITLLMPRYKTRWTIAAGIRQLIDAYRSASLTNEQFQSGRFMRLRHIQNLLDEGRLSNDLRWLRHSASIREVA